MNCATQSAPYHAAALEAFPEGRSSAGLRKAHCIYTLHSGGDIPWRGAITVGRLQRILSLKQKQSYASARDALISINLRRASQVMVRDFADSVRQYNISSAQHRMLSWIKAHPGRNQSEAATAIGMQRTNFAPIIEELEKRGLVDRERADGRSNALTVTSSGAAMVRMINRKIEVHEAKFSALMTQEEKAILLSILHRIGAYPENASDG